MQIPLLNPLAFSGRILIRFQTILGLILTIYELECYSLNSTEKRMKFEMNSTNGLGDECYADSFDRE